MKKSLFFLFVLVSGISVFGQTTSFDNLNANPLTGKSISWTSSNYGSGFGHRIINSDPGGQTLLNFQGRHNSSTWSDLMTLTSNGNVGIGTTNPTSKLNVLGNIKNTGTNPSIHIEGTGTGNYQGANLIMSAKGVSSGNKHVSTWFMTHRSTDGIASIEMQRRGLNAEYNGSLLTYKDGTGWRFNVAENETSGLSNAFNITENGKVGIGTTNPREKLEINSNTSGDAVLRIEADTNNSNESNNARIELYQDGALNGAFIGFDETWGGDMPDNIFRIGTRAGGQNNYDNLTVNLSSGNIGIGTSSPTDKLEVIGNVRSSNKFVVTGIGALEKNNTDFRLWSVQKMNFGSGISNTHMTIDTNGYVGIGTTTPDAKLAVNGDIHAKEVKVDLDFPAPDYVFLKDYDLKTINEVEAYIQKEGHLPNIPSAKILEENGVDLGVMNMKLLEKIEELTLYTIAQEKKILHQENRNTKLEKAILKQELINDQLKINNQNLEARLAKIEALLNKK